jgi:hypothetical protein
MELIHNATFRLLPDLVPYTEYKPGIYRVILEEPKLNMVITVLIQPDGEPETRKCGRKIQATTKKKRRRHRS